MRIRSQNQSIGEYTKRAKHQGLCNNGQGRRSLKPIVGWTV